jgi:hypothetical protein
MAETKKITSLYVVTDSETSYDNIGDIDGGGIDKEWLKKHIKSYGADGLFKQIAWMNFQVFEAMKEVNQESHTSVPCDAIKMTPPNVGD